MTLYYAGKKIRDRGANSGLFYAGNVIKKGSVVGGYDKHFSIPNKITLEDSTGAVADNPDAGRNIVWRISIHFTIPDVMSDQRLFGSVATPYSGGVVIGVLNGHLRYWLSSGNGWDIAEGILGNYTLVAGSTYTLLVERCYLREEKRYYYHMVIKPDGGIWTTDININNTAPIKSGFYHNLGRDWGVFSNSITYHLDKNTSIARWDSGGSKHDLWTCDIDGVVPVQGISKVYLPCFIKMYNKPSFNKNIGSGFTDNDFFTVGEAWSTLSTADNFEIVMKVTTGNDIASQQYILTGTGSAARSIVVFLVHSCWYLQLSSQGTSYDICDKLSAETPLPNMTYWFKLKFTGSRYVLSISTDGISFKGIIVAESSAKVYNAASYDLGAVIGATNWYWRGSIDFSGCYVNINGGRAWDYTSTRFKTLVYDFQKT